MSDILIRREGESQVVGTVSRDDMDLITKVREYSVFLTKRGTWIIRLPAKMMAGVPYIIPSDESLLTLLLDSPMRGQSKEIDEKIEELSL